MNPRKHSQGGLAFSLPLVLTILSSCAAGWEAAARPEPLWDLTPPRCLSVVREPDGYRLDFDEVIAAGRTEGAVPSVLTTEQRSAWIRVTPPDSPEGRIRLLVKDEAGNTLQLGLPWRPWNSRRAGVVLNEVHVAGAGKHPDLIELLVVTEGQLDGLKVSNGQGNSAWAWELPPLRVQPGDLISLHLKPQGGPEERNEGWTGQPDSMGVPKSASGGWDASDQAYDLWIAGAPGLTATNGVILLMDVIRGEWIDGLVYSNRTSASDTQYGGWGSRSLYEDVQQWARKGLWFPDSLPRPENAVSSLGLTGTKTMARRRNDLEVFKADAWTAPVSATWGQPNLP